MLCFSIHTLNHRCTRLKTPDGGHKLWSEEGVGYTFFDEGGVGGSMIRPKKWFCARSGQNFFTIMFVNARMVVRA